MIKPTARKGIYELYWKFAFERQRIFERRQSGIKPPWTDDPILREYKFCNVYRAADYISQALIKETACNKDFDATDDQLFQIMAFRFFSKVETWEGLKSFFGRPPMIRDLKDGNFLKALEETRKKNKTIYTSAFILCANKAFDYDEKHKNHAALFKKMFIDDDLAKKLRAAKSLKEIYKKLHDYPLMGDFMSYQIAIDLNYSSQVNFGENDFCQAGPGALRGIKKAFVDTGRLSPSDVVFWMVERQTEEFRRLGLDFQGLYGRPLHAIDAQGLFCELDKYCRVAAPELSSARKKIKTRFTPLHRPQELFFPAKWGINLGR